MEDFSKPLWRSPPEELWEAAKYGSKQDTAALVKNIIELVSYHDSKGRETRLWCGEVNDYPGLIFPHVRKGDTGAGMIVDLHNFLIVGTTRSNAYSEAISEMEQLVKQAARDQCTRDRVDLAWAAIFVGIRARLWIYSTLLNRLIPLFSEEPRGQAGGVPAWRKHTGGRDSYPLLTHLLSIIVGCPKVPLGMLPDDWREIILRDDKNNNRRRQSEREDVHITRMNQIRRHFDRSGRF